MQPDNMIMSDMGIGIDLAESTQEDPYIEEKQMAAYTSTPEFERMKAFCEERIKFYQKYLPNGDPIADPAKVNTNNWIIANTVISEFNGILAVYQNAVEAVKEISKVNE